MTMMRTWYSKVLRTPFDRLNALSILVTLGMGAAVYLYCAVMPDKEPTKMTRHLMHYLGFIHFAVGYQFFFASPPVRAQVAGFSPSFFAKLLGCVGAGVLVYQFQTLEPLVYTLFYLHAAENAVFHILKLPATPAARPTVNALFPLLVVLTLPRLSPDYLRSLAAPIPLVRLGMVLGSLVFMRALLPATSWKSGWVLAGQYPWVIACFLGVAFFIPENSIPYDLFIIWHYVIWFAYTWVEKPAARVRLLWSHAVFAVAYKALFLLADARVVLFHPLVLQALVGSMAFLAQTTSHILLSFVFRKFPAMEGAPQPAVGVGAKPLERIAVVMPRSSRVSG